jgi:molybdopterin-guanine dinucleotide biosynthesis protein A
MEPTSLSRSLELAVLVAGGKSRRMGRDKALLEWEGKPIWQHQLEKLQALRPQQVAIAAPERPSWLPSRVAWIQDAIPSQQGQPGHQGPIGPLGGLLAALEAASDGLVATLAVDLPALGADYLRSLLAVCGTATGVVPLGPFGFESLAAIYPARAAKVARDWADAGHQDLQGLVAKLVRGGQLITHPVSADEQPCFRNLNTPADLAEAVTATNPQP